MTTQPLKCWNIMKHDEVCHLDPFWIHLEAIWKPFGSCSWRQPRGGFHIHRCFGRHIGHIAQGLEVIACQPTWQERCGTHQKSGLKRSFHEFSSSLAGSTACSMNHHTWTGGPLYVSSLGEEHHFLGNLSIILSPVPSVPCRATYPWNVGIFLNGLNVCMPRRVPTT